MKKLLFLALVFLVVVLTACDAGTRVVVGNTITVTWDAPDLTGIPATEISYEVALALYPDGPVNLIATVMNLEAPIVFSTDSAAFKIGVRVKRTVAADGTVVYSEYLWSSVGGDPQPWYVVYYKIPGAILKLRVK